MQRRAPYRLVRKARKRSGSATFFTLADRSGPKAKGESGPRAGIASAITRISSRVAQPWRRAVLFMPPEKPVKLSLGAKRPTNRGQRLTPVATPIAD
jgi:hypothetical protein